LKEERERERCGYGRWRVEEKEEGWVSGSSGFTRRERKRKKGTGVMSKVRAR